MSILEHVVLIIGSLSVWHILSTHTKINSVIFYIIIGVILWSNWLRLVQSTELAFLGEIGLIFLMFYIWTHLDIKTFKNMSREIFTLWGLQVILSWFFLTLWLGLFYFLHQSTNETGIILLILGISLSLSSSAIVLEKLIEHNLVNTTLGKAKTGVLIFQDLMVPLLLIFIPVIVANSHNLTFNFLFTEVSKVIWYVIILILTLMLCFKLFIKRLLPIIETSESKWFLTLFWVILALLWALWAELLHLSPGIGALISWLLLWSTKYRENAVEETESYKEIFMSIFFLYIWTLIDVSIIITYWYWILLLTIIIKFSKIIGSYLSARLLQYSHKESIIFWINLSQVSEFTLVICWLLMWSSQISIIDYQILNSSIIMTMILSALFIDKTNTYIHKHRHI